MRRRSEVITTSIAYPAKVKDQTCCFLQITSATTTPPQKITARSFKMLVSEDTRPPWQNMIEFDLLSLKNPLALAKEISGKPSFDVLFEKLLENLHAEVSASRTMSRKLATRQGRFS